MAKIQNAWQWIKSKRLYRRKLFWAAVVIIILILIFAFHGNGKKAGLEVEAAAPRNVVDVVSQSGTVEASKDINLSFLSGGRVAGVLVKEGDHVEAGQTLAVLENTQQHAVLIEEQSAYQKLLSGVTDTQENVLRTSLQSAKDTLVQTKAAQDLSVENAREALYSTDLTAYLEGTISEGTSKDYTPPTISGTYTGTETGEYDIELYGSSAPSGYSFRYTGLESGIGTVKTTGPEALGTRGLYIQFPENFAHGSNAKWVVPVPNTRGAKYVALESAYESALQAEGDKVNAVQDALDVAQANYDQGTAPARSEDLTAARAGVAGAQAALSGTIIRAPFSGTITDVSAKVGENASGAAPALSMISANKYELKINIPEADIANISVGDPATVTFDAYGNDKFEASVVAVAPSAKEVNGVTTIETTLEFTKADPRIKDGLSADADIRAKEEVNVLAVPGTSVIETDNGTFVRVLKEGVTPSAKVTENDVTLVPVTIGLHGSEGYTEIISGLKAGDKVLTLIPDALRDTLEDRLDAKLASSTADALPEGSSTGSTTLRQ